MVDRNLGLKASLSNLKPRLSSLKHSLCAAIPRDAQPGQQTAKDRHREVLPTSRMLENTAMGDGGDYQRS